MVGQIDLDALNRPKSSEHKKESPVEKKEPVKSEETKAEVKTKEEKSEPAVSVREEVKPAEEENKPVAEPKQEVVSQSNPEPQIVEPKVKEAVVEQEVKEEKEEEEEGIDIEAKPEITFEDFEKMQFQVGEIIACEAVKKSKKLLCSQVKIGSQVKQIVSGIKAHYTPEEMVGKKVMVLVNLKPAKLAGVLSEGMLLCAEDADGNLALMTPEKKMPAGAEIC